MGYLTRNIEFPHRILPHPAFLRRRTARIREMTLTPWPRTNNYVLEVTVAGAPDRRPGMVLDLKELKDILPAARKVTERMDHGFQYEVS